MTDMPDIPDFLRISQERRAETWKGRRVRSIRTMKFAVPKKDIPADVRAFMKEDARKRKAAQDERFAMLKERAALKKRQAGR